MSAKVFFVLSLHFFSCNAKESLLEYCGKDSYSYAPLRKGPEGQEYTLKQVHVIIRYIFFHDFWDTEEIVIMLGHFSLINFVTAWI